MLIMYKSRPLRHWIPHPDREPSRYLVLYHSHGIGLRMVAYTFEIPHRLACRYGSRHDSETYDTKWVFFVGIVSSLKF